MKKILLMLAIAIFTTSCGDDSTGTQAPPVSSTIKDRFGNEYKVVKVGIQTWMVENFGAKLDTTIRNEQTGANQKIIMGIAYDNNEANVPNYGRLYYFDEAIMSKMIPEGYRMPTKADWDILFKSVGGIDRAAKLKSQSLWNAPNTGAVNEYGFNAVPGGYTASISGQFLDIGKYGRYWCAPADSTQTLQCVSFQYQTNEVKYYTADADQMMSVRFIKKY